jgi:hypothetical protein
MEVNLAHWRLLIPQRLLCVFTPKFRGADNNSMDKRLLPRSSEEAVEILPLNSMASGIELALDSVIFTCSASSRHKVNADVTSIEVLHVRPFGVGPNVGV